MVTHLCGHPSKVGCTPHTPKIWFVETDSVIHAMRGCEKVCCSLYEDLGEDQERSQAGPRLACKKGKGHLLDFVMIKR